MILDVKFLNTILKVLYRLLSKDFVIQRMPHDQTEVNTASGNGLVPSGNKSLHESRVVLFSDAIWHYDDVIMGTIASQITSLTSVYSTVYSGADQSKHQSSASLAFVWGIHRGRWIPRSNGQLRGKCFHLMTSPWYWFTFKQTIMNTFKGNSKIHTT